jgi:hypothetical protein
MDATKKTKGLSPSPTTRDGNHTIASSQRWRCNSKSKDLSRLCSCEKFYETKRWTANVNWFYPKIRINNFENCIKWPDVLSFVRRRKEILGEISHRSSEKQAPKWKNTFYDELKRLVVHGSLHFSRFWSYEPRSQNKCVRDERVFRIEIKLKLKP